MANVLLTADTALKMQSIISEVLSVEAGSSLKLFSIDIDAESDDDEAIPCPVDEVMVTASFLAFTKNKNKASRAG